MVQEILRVLAGAMGLPDPTSDDIFDTAFSIAEGERPPQGPAPCSGNACTPPLGAQMGDVMP